MIRKRVIPVAAALAAVLAIAACSSSSTSSSTTASGATSAPATSAASAKYTVAGVYENTQDPFWATFVCGAKAEAQQLGVNLKV